ncbi:transmembrane protein 168-like [Pecten maximus]|uniref:transmembrane protein 168-like n=1 Tax=Pecten maximus TaxID=6579 RepID=UPI001458538D|nr:transmembrane protein 168-like [Pecten maximus]
MKLKDLHLTSYMGYLPNIILVAALALGLYTQWQYSQNTVILVVAILGLFVFGLSCACQYYFNFESLGRTILHIWLGCILGVIVFSREQKEIEYIMTQEVMNILFMTSLIVSCFWAITQRVMRLIKHEAKLCESMELLECLGLSIATLITGQQAIPITLFIISVICHLMAIRLKSIFGLASFIGMIVVSFVFFRDEKLYINIYGLICFVGRHACPPIIDLYFSDLTTLDRWQKFFNYSRLLRHLCVFFTFIVNVTLAVFIGKQITSHKEWFVVVPIFAVFSLIWLCFHIIYVISCWKLMSKVTECNSVYKSMSDERRSLNRIMSSKGVRHFSLVSVRLICVTLVTTLVLFGLGWTTRTGYSQALLFVVLPLECMTLSLFRELGDSLGGTAIGYAIISPVSGQRPGAGVKLYAPSSVQDMGSYAMATLNKICQFFDFHMINNFGTDFSSSGMSQEFLQSKVKAFFGRCCMGENGPRYDTYLLYYSGDVYDTGDWALADNKNLKLDTLLEWWSEKNLDSGARLILVLDSLHSYHWAKEVRYIRDDFVAIQTCRYKFRQEDLEQGEKPPAGSFSQDWVHYNMDAAIEQDWLDKERTTRAIYGVSKRWTDFTFHMPTERDIADHCDSSFPKLVKPLVQVVNYRGVPCHGVSLCFCCDVVIRCMKRKRMRWLPPKEVDTKHGFKLVQS